MSEEKLYKLEFEIVSPLGAGAVYYNGEKPICKPDEVAHEVWQKVSKQTSDPWQQYNQLLDWVKTGEQLVRNVQLFSANLPEWVPINQT